MRSVNDPAIDTNVVTTEWEERSSGLLCRVEDWLECRVQDNGDWEVGHWHEWCYHRISSGYCASIKLAQAKAISTATFYVHQERRALLMNNRGINRKGPSFGHHRYLRLHEH